MRRALTALTIALAIGGATAGAASAADATKAQVKKAALKATAGGTVTKAKHSDSGWKVHVVRAGVAFDVKVSDAGKVTKIQRTRPDDTGESDHGGGDEGNGSDG